jgi:Lrp/AsnC family leucine-responsive transcriptional regulator
MKFDREELDLDPTDVRILELLQQNCKQPLAAIGEQVGLTAPSVMERIHKLEGAGVIRGYAALLDARALGKDVTAFIGVSVSHPKAIAAFEGEIDRLTDVLECHHVTGQHTLILKAKTDNTEALERLIDWIREIDGVTRTETMVVLSTKAERVRVALDAESATYRRSRRAGTGRLRRAVSSP